MYIGRFAPTPSGALHFGSLVTALASFLEAKHNSGKWLVRIEDLDFKRNIPNVDKVILQQLEDFGLLWDDAPIYQSDHLDYYQNILDILKHNNFIYACDCSRKNLSDNLYKCKCCDKNLGFNQKTAWRLRLNLTQTIEFLDGIFQNSAWRLDSLGDPILKRRDGVIAYQLAVVVDDNLSKINHIVRGADLLSSTAWQICIYNAMQWQIPTFSHIPLVKGEDGKKLSKQNLAPQINKENRVELIIKALNFLRQEVPNDFFDKHGKADIKQKDLLDFAVKYWDITKLVVK